jgi:hypothetical protein
MAGLLLRSSSSSVARAMYAGSVGHDSRARRTLGRCALADRGEDFTQTVEILGVSKVGQAAPVGREVVQALFAQLRHVWNRRANQARRAESCPRRVA